MHLRSVLFYSSVVGLFVVTKSGKSPEIVDIGKFKPVTLSYPAKASCGRNGQTTEYCAPPFDQKGFRNLTCKEQYCQEKCTGRDRKSAQNE